MMNSNYIDKLVYPKRLVEVVNILADVTNKTYDEMLELVRDTDTGRALKLNRQDLLYEQVTDNVWAIVTELGQKDKIIIEECTPKKIAEAYISIEKRAQKTARRKFCKSSLLKKAQKKRNHRYITRSVKTK